MKRTTKLGERFFESTRGRIVSLLRGTTGTVTDLAAALGLTDNAVRAHLLTLERDGLVQQRGVKQGARKPHFVYELTAEAEHLFPKSYDMLLNHFIALVKEGRSREEMAEMMTILGRSLAAQLGPGAESVDMESRVQGALRALEALGGAARLEQEEERMVIRSNRCPLAAVVCVHPEVCGLAETMIAEILGVPVRERCHREGSPRCCFEIGRTPA